MAKGTRVADLDGVDLAILAKLHQSGRSSFAEIGKSVGLAATSTAERIRRLEQAGVIEGYTVRLSAKMLGYSLTAFILARPVGPDARFIKIASARHEILECHRVTGDVSFIVRAAVSDVQNLEDVLNHLETATSYVETLVVLSTSFENRPISMLGVPAEGAV